MIERHDVTEIRRVSLESADDLFLPSLENPNDSSFGTSFGAALDSRDDTVTVHGVHQVSGRDVDVLLLVDGPASRFCGGLGMSFLRRPPHGVLGHHESKATGTGLQATDDQIHLLGQSESVPADLQEHAVAYECLQLTLEAAALFARHAEKLCQLARVGRVMDLVTNQSENFVAGKHGEMNSRRWAVSGRQS